MKRVGIGLGTTTVLIVAGLVVLQNLGAININWPWNNVPAVLADETTFVTPEKAEITSIEAVSLDCRARISAHVPVEGRREHSVAGQVYRTDKVTAIAIGDIDTCVDGTMVEIIEDEGRYRVLVPADAITFERPRVDAELTQDSVEYGKGWVGKLTDAFPWVSDNSALTPAAYTFSQNVIGSSECMKEAFKVTESIIVDAYRDEMIDKGLDEDNVTVRVIGEPVFGEPIAEELGDFDFKVADEGIVCQVAAGVVTAPSDQEVGGNN